MKDGMKILVKQTKSLSGRTDDMIDTLKALGLGRIGKQRQMTVNPALWGMLKKVRHMIEVEPA